MTLKSPTGYKIKFIVNPNAGHHALEHRWEDEFYPYLLKKFKHCDFEFTESKNHATELTRKALYDGFNLIVSVGGDGTLNEVVNGFFEKAHQINPDAVLGILPFGSGCDFSRTFKYPKDFKKACDLLLTKKTKPIDIGMIEFKNKDFIPRYFINIANMGLAVEIMRKVNKKNKRIPSSIRYATGTFQGYFYYTNTKIRLHLHPQGTVTTRIANLIVANGQYFGGGMRPAPQAKTDDGIFEVIILKNTNLFELAFYWVQLYFKKRFMPSRIYEHYRADKIHVEVLDDKNELHTEMDGEIYGGGDQTITLLPNAIKLKI